jgi:hypothetical protein
MQRNLFTSKREYLIQLNIKYLKHRVKKQGQKHGGLTSAFQKVGDGKVRKSRLSFKNKEKIDRKKRGGSDIEIILQWKGE